MLRTSSRSQLREKKCSFRSSSTKPVEKDPQEVGPGWDSTFSKDLIQRDVKKDDLLYKGAFYSVKLLTFLKLCVKERHCRA